MVRKETKKTGKLMGRLQQLHETEASEVNFFKVMVGSFASKLCLPPALTRYFRLYKCANATIKSSISGTWPVKVHKNNNLLIFKAGWPEFVKCHMLQYGDFLVFKCNGQLNFEVKIFGKTSYQQMAAPVAKTGMSSKEEEAEELRGPSKDLTNGFAVPRGSQRKRPHDCQEVLYPSGKPLSIFRHLYASQRRPVTGEEKARALEAACALKLNQPHFMVTMSNTNVYRGFALYIPRAFLLEYPFKKGSMITLQSPNGKPWKVRYWQTGGRGKFSFGWGAFAIGHNLEQGDVCVFELIKRKGPLMKAHIFRVVDTITPLVLSGFKRRKPEKSTGGC